MADNKEIVERLHFIARTDTDLLGYVAQKAADELQQLRAEVERQRATILLLGLADIERLAAEVERLRALIAEWDAAHGDWVDTPQWDEGDWYRAEVRLGAAEDALIEEARRG